MQMDCSTEWRSQLLQGFPEALGVTSVYSGGRANRQPETKGPSERSGEGTLLLDPQGTSKRSLVLGVEFVEMEQQQPHGLEFSRAPPNLGS